MTDDELGTALIGCAMKVHSGLGPGLLESVYEVCLAHELEKSKIKAARQRPVPIAYDGVTFEEGFKIDILVEDRIIVELKMVEKLLPIHSAQLLTYLKLTERRVGYLLNFNVTRMREGGIKRLVNG
ncbi:MAG: GxxExxY protein [Burkholderiales bacterium]